MGEEYVNRKGDRYFLRQGTTKTGKAKYFCSRKKGGELVETMPDGYEWRENPANGIVTIRKIIPSQISPFEKQLLIQTVRTQTDLDRFLVDDTGDALVVYVSDQSSSDIARTSDIVGRLFPGDADALIDGLCTATNYSPVMRFELRDDAQRLFSVQRWCYRGAIDRWITLEQLGPLKDLADRYVRHLGEESFFELI